MGKLGDILGDDFEEEYEGRRQEVQEQRRKVPKETLMEICYEAIEAGGFDGDEPRFTFDTGEVEHDVVLMESPRDEISKFIHVLDEESGSKSLGMFHLGELWSAVFREEMVGLIDKIEEDEYYLVVGRYQENVRDKGTEDERVFYNISPVRGILPLETAKEYADKYKSQMEGSSVEEQAQKQQEEVEEESDEEDIMLGTSEEEEVVDEDKVIKVFKAIGDKDEQILRDVAAGDKDSIDTLVNTVESNVEGEPGSERILDIFEEEVGEIEGRGEEEEEEDIDLGGLDEDEEEVEEESSESEGGDVDDWF